MALGDRLGGKVRSVVRRARRDGPLDIVFVLFNADGMGGTARSGIEQANALLALGEGHRVRILSVWRSGDATHYPLADGLEVTYLVDVRHGRATAVSGGHPDELADRESVIVPRSWDALYNGLTDATMREALGSIEADVLVTTTPELLAVVAQLAPADVALVHQEHRASSARVNDLGALLEFAPRADVVVSLTESMSRWLAGRLGGAAPELLVIPNPLPGTPQPRSPLDQKTFVTAGRLAPEKQFEHLVDAFWRIHEEIPGWTLTIWGDGPRADNLAAQVRKLGLEDRVLLPGSTQDLAAEWARASVAVLASRGEGYPLVLQEAMSAGVPPVSYDCPSGPREMITHDVDGLLVPPASKAAMAAAMLRIATDDDLRTRLGAAALTRSERWDGQRLARQWVGTFRHAVERRADPLAPRRVLHGLRPGPLGDLPETSSAAGITPAEARTTTLRVLTSAAAATGDGWFVMPARGLDPHPVVVVPSSRRGDFLTALAAAPVPDWLSVRDPAERGWHERRGTVAAMTDELSRTRTASLFLEPWPMRGGHDGVLGEGVEVGVQFWEESPDGDLLAPGLNRFGDRVPAGTPRTTTTVDGRRRTDPRAHGAAHRRRRALRRRRRLHLGRRRRRGLARRARPADRRRRRHAERAGGRRAALQVPRRAALLDAQPPPLRPVGAPDPPRHRRPGAVVARHVARQGPGRRPPRHPPRVRAADLQLARHRDQAARRPRPRRPLRLRQRRRLPRPAAASRALLHPRRAVRRLRGRPPRRRPARHRRPALPDGRAQQPPRPHRRVRGRADADDDAQPAPAAAYDPRGDRGPLPRRGRPDDPGAVPLGDRPVAAVRRSHRTTA